LRATVGVTHAVRRVSPVWRVTAAQGNWLIALDGRPAYEAFASVVPSPLRAHPRRALAAVLAGLLVGEDEFVARHLLALDAERGALAVAAPIADGQRVLLGVRDPLGAREDLQRVLADQAAAWQAPAAAAALYVPCVGRARGPQAQSRGAGVQGRLAEVGRGVESQVTTIMGGLEERLSERLDVLLDRLAVSLRRDLDRVRERLRAVENRLADVPKEGVRELVAPLQAIASGAAERASAALARIEELSLRLQHTERRIAELTRETTRETLDASDV